MFIKSNKYNTEWHKVFLWFQIRSEDGIHWLKFVERKYLHLIDRPILSSYEPYRYRLLK